jgi:hypothetical protein
LDRCVAALQHCSIAANGKYVKWSKQWSIELFLAALRSGDIHPVVGLKASSLSVSAEYHEQSCHLPVP